MRRLTYRFAVLAVFVGALAAALWSSPASAAGSAAGYGSVELKWHSTPIITLAITPNYQSGYGPQGGAGSGSTPAPGAGASLGAGVVDFGTQVVQGYAYLYKYAVQAAVMTNDGSGFTVYAEGQTDIQDNTAGGTIPISQTLYWLKTSSGNTPFSSATPFEATTSPSCGVGCIAYGGAPPPSAVVWQYGSSTLGQPSNTLNQGFDYQLRLYSSPPADNFSVYIVYTAVGN
jgi:hypothetical protein